MFEDRELLSQKIDYERTLYEFHEELGLIEHLHRFLVTAVPEVFDRTIADLAQGQDPEQYEYPDAMWDAEKLLGVTPWDVNTHSGLMAISRAVSLSELTLARMAACTITAPEIFVYPDGRMWNRDLEGLFYKYCLVSPFSTKAHGFSSLRSLRDLYVHGYGLAPSQQAREKLAARLYSQIDTSDLTADEAALGYDGEVGFFGKASLVGNRLTAGADGSLRASLTPLAAHRALKQMSTFIDSAALAISKGLKDGQTRDNNAFVRRTAERAESHAQPT